MKNFWLVAIFVLSALTGCGPMYSTNYTYTPPPTAEGRMCASQCRQISRMCVQNCEMKEETCKSRARHDAIYKFEHYAAERRAKNQSIKKDVSDFSNEYSCSSSSCESNCQPEYRDCYANCGGRVTPHTVCTAFCK